MRQLTRQVKELDQLKAQFFTDVSHELRAPLALVLGPTRKLLANGELTVEQRHDLEVIDRNARTLLKRVNDLLDIAKLEAGGGGGDPARGGPGPPRRPPPAPPRGVGPGPPV